MLCLVKCCWHSFDVVSHTDRSWIVGKEIVVAVAIDLW